MQKLSAVILLTLTLLGPGASHAAAVGGDIQLVDQTGRPFSLGQARGKVVILAFGYTFCPDICPTTLAVMAAAMRQLGDQADRVLPVFVSLDPDRDTPEKLASYVGYFHPSLIALTGSAEALSEVARRYRARYAFVGKEDGPSYSLDHTASLYVIGPDGELARIIPYGLPPEEISRSVRELLAPALATRH